MSFGYRLITIFIFLLIIDILSFLLKPPQNYLPEWWDITLYGLVFFILYISLIAAVIINFTTFPMLK